MGKLILEDGFKLSGRSFGYEGSAAGEVVFATGMVGYPESLTDPSYAGQILIFTYPLIGNYGVPEDRFLESSKIHPVAVIVCNYTDTPSHFTSKKTLSEWLTEEKIPALEISDTRYLTKKLREKGTMLGKVVITKDVALSDPNGWNIVAEVSTKKVIKQGNGKKAVVLIDCGKKNNIERNFLQRDVSVITVPWDYDIFSGDITFDGIMISNGPGDPKQATKTIETIREALNRRVPTFGICLGNQLLALAAGGDTFKLKYGHRSQNQPCMLTNSRRCYITTQNHGFSVGTVPKGFKEWFTNANDGTNEGIMHPTLPFMSVQFHPESFPGPQDTDWLFDHFLEKL